MYKKSSFKFLLLVLAVIGLFSCTPISYQNSEDNNWSNLSSFKTAVHGSIWSDLANHFELPDGDHKEVAAEIRRFQQHPDYLEDSLRHGAPYIYYIFEQTRSRHLPAELALLPAIESDYDPFNCSRTGANGLWQMMPGTASGFGLKINWWYDGRRDIIASTRAALRYLSYLHEYFSDDWLLAVAAYDAGEGKVYAAVNSSKKQGKEVDFWLMHLPRETRTYVPRLLALAEIIRNPDKYGIKLPPVSDTPYLQEVDVGGQIDVNLAAEFAGVTPEVLRKLNPGLRRFATDPDGPYTLLVPIDNASNFALKVAQLNLRNHFVWREHVVKPDETLALLVKKYKLNSNLVVQANNLKNKQIRRGQILVLPFSVASNTESKLALADKEPAKLMSKKSISASAVAESVTNSENNHQNGDKQENNKIWNRLEKTAPKATHGVVAEEKLPGPKRVVHVVKAGETLGAIGRKYGVKSQQIVFWNQLQHDGKPLAVNQELVIWIKSQPKSKKVQLADKSSSKKNRSAKVNLAKRD